MDDLVEALSKDDVQFLKEVLPQRLTKETQDEKDKFTTEDLEDLFLHASYLGSLRCLEFLSEYGAYIAGLNTSLYDLNNITPIQQYNEHGSLRKMLFGLTIPKTENYDNLTSQSRKTEYIIVHP